MNPVARSMDQALTFPAKLIYLVALSAMSSWKERITLYIHGKLPMYKYVLSPKLFCKFFFWILEHMFAQKRCYKGMWLSQISSQKCILAHDVTEILYIGREKHSGTKYLCKQEHINTRQIFLEPFPLKPQTMKGEFYPPIAAVWWKRNPPLLLSGRVLLLKTGGCMHFSIPLFQCSWTFSPKNP